MFRINSFLCILALAYTTSPVVVAQDQADTLVYDTAPRWMADGESVLFYTYRHDPEGAELYTVSINTGELTRLTHTYYNEWWSEPAEDPSVIYVSSDYSKQERFGGAEIFELNLITKNLTRITPDTGEGIFNILPRISPDGNQLVYSGDFIGPSENAEIFLLDLKDGAQINLTNSEAIDRSASWSPDGSRILFSSDRSGNFDLFSMALDGSDIQQLTDTPWNETGPDWSPDGSEVVYSSDETGAPQLYIMNVQDGVSTRLTTSNSRDVHASWSPNGEWITFASYRHGNKDKGDIYLIRPDGSEERRLTPQ